MIPFLHDISCKILMYVNKNKNANSKKICFDLALDRNLFYNWTKKLAECGYITRTENKHFKKDYNYELTDLGSSGVTHIIALYGLTEEGKEFLRLLGGTE